MKELIIKVLMILAPVILETLRSRVTNEKFVKYGDKVLDWVERAIQKKPDWYDEMLMELVGILRTAAAIPDLPDE